MGTIDRILRFILCVVIDMLYIVGAVSGIFGLLLVILTAALMLTTIVSFCPLYAAYGISSSQNKITFLLPKNKK